MKKIAFVAMDSKGTYEYTNLINFVVIIEELNKRVDVKTD